MEISIIKIKCPCCGAILAVKMKPDIERKRITCPACKEVSFFKSFKLIEDKPEHTEYAGSDEHTSYAEETSTFRKEQNAVIGRIKSLEAGAFVYHKLQLGRNVIGRKSEASSANLQIFTGDNRRMSREHVVIDVKKIPGKGYVHYASLYKEKVNDTFINNECLVFGDCVILKDGDKLKLPDAMLIFETPSPFNDEMTM